MEGNTSNKPKARGFAAMDNDRQREIARKGGKAAHERGTAHEFTADEARAAGRKGGERVSVDRAHMALIGRLGGKSSAGRRAAHRGKPEDNSPEGNNEGAPKGE